MKRLVFRSFTLFVLCFSLLAARQARADTINYVYQVGSDTFKWALPTMPSAVSTCGSGMCSFQIAGLPFTQNGGMMTGTFDFFDTSNSAGFDLVGPPTVPEPTTILLSANGLAIGLALSVLRKN